MLPIAGEVLMRDAKYNDGWRRVNSVERYPLKLTGVVIDNLAGFSSPFNINFNAGLSALCGKNGVGKSTLLKVIFQKLKNNLLEGEKITVNTEVIVEIEGASPGLIEEKLFYLDPSYECARIIKFLLGTENSEELLEGLEVNGILNKEANIKAVSRAIGKPYKKIDVYEVESSLEEDHTFPFFKVELPDGTEYSSTSMGMGEHLCMYLFWYVNWLNKKSILLIEEIENYLSPYSQETLIDYLAYMLSDRKIWTIITSHSEYILNKIGAANTHVLHTRNGQTKNVNSKRQREYLKALGIGEKTKGAFLVEDECAALFLKYIINYLDPSLLDTREIIGLRCDSNLERLIQHFEPHITPEYDFFVIFDADQSSKIFNISNRFIGASALPSSGLLCPDEELWNTLIQFRSGISNTLAIQNDRLEEAIAEHSLADHHDRLKRIASELNITYESLLSGICKQWLTIETNFESAVYLVLAIKFRNLKIPLVKIKNYATDIADTITLSTMNQTIADISDDKHVNFRFNGRNIEVA